MRSPIGNPRKSWRFDDRSIRTFPVVSGVVLSIRTRSRAGTILTIGDRFPYN